MACLRLARLVGTAILATSVAACSVYVNVEVGAPASGADASASKTPRPDEVCSTGLLEIQGLQVCVQEPFPNASGALVAVGILNPRYDAAALIKPDYRALNADGTQATGGLRSMVGSESGLLALPGGGWAHDYLTVPSGTAKTAIQLDVTWLPGKSAAYAAYTRLQIHTTCIRNRPFTGCLLLNRNAYPISVRLQVSLISTKPDGSWVVEREIGDGPDVVLPAGGVDTLVAASDDETSAITDWLALDATNRFNVDATSSLSQPEFPGP
jgi:hypothetical protein